MCAFFLREKNRGTRCHILGRVLVMTPSGQSSQIRMSDDTENSQDDHSKRTVTILQTEAFKATEDTLYQDRNSRTEGDKEAAPHKGTDDRPLIPEPLSNTFMLPAICSL